MNVPVFWMFDPEADSIKSPFVRQPHYNDLENRIRELEAALRRADDIEHSISAEDWYKQRDALLATSETPVSTLCAVCDQIKELHPASHPWTAKTTAQETPAEPTYYMPAYSNSSICKHCGAHVRDHEFGGRCNTSDRGGGK